MNSQNKKSFKKLSFKKLRRININSVKPAKLGFFELV